jgi:hypothetical protein
LFLITSLLPHPLSLKKKKKKRLDLGMKSLQECIDVLQSEVTEISENVSKVTITASSSSGKTTETNVMKFILSIILVHFTAVYVLVNNSM